MSQTIKVSKSEIAQKLQAVPLFERCSKRDLRTIARHVEVVAVSADTAIVKHGSTGDAFFVVLSGQVEVIGPQANVALGPGDHFGELALLDPAPRSASVVATSATELGVLTVRMFRVLLRDMPQVSERMLASLANQLRLERAGNSH